MDYRIPASVIILILTFVCFEKFARSFIEFFSEETNLYTFCDLDTGILESGQYFYKSYNLNDTIINFNLKSSFGDADLYVSRSNYPKYNLKDHDISSYTCGEDQIIIENHPLGHPLYAGVYCFSAYNNCTFELKVCGSTPLQLSSVIPNDNVKYDPQKTANKKKSKSKTSSKLKSTFLSFIDLLFREILSL